MNTYYITLFVVSEYHIRDGDPVVLISHEPITVEESSLLDLNTAAVRVYALVRLSLSPTSDKLVLKGGIQVLPYELVCLLLQSSKFQSSYP